MTTRNVQMMGFQTGKSGYAGINNSGFKKNNRIVNVNYDVNNPDTVYKDDSIPLTKEEMNKIKQTEALKMTNEPINELEIPKDIKGGKDLIPDHDSIKDDIPNREIVDANDINDINKALEDVALDSKINKNVDTGWRLV